VLVLVGVVMVVLSECERVWWLSSACLTQNLLHLTKIKKLKKNNKGGGWDDVVVVIKQK